MACLTALYLFAKSRPQLLVEHVQTLQPYLQIHCELPGDYMVSYRLNTNYLCKYRVILLFNFYILCKDCRLYRV